MDSIHQLRCILPKDDPHFKPRTSQISLSQNITPDISEGEKKVMEIDKERKRIKRELQTKRAEEKKKEKKMSIFDEIIGAENLHSEFP
jgi:hypothetical protein